MYPINLQLTGRSCAVIGGGQVALRKVKNLLAAGACVTVFSPQLEPALQVMLEEAPDILRWRPGAYRQGCLQGFFLVFCTADDPQVNRQAALEAKAAGSLVNAATEPGLCDFMVPAKVERGSLLLTVSTGGASPALARLLRQQLEEEFSEAYGIWLERLMELRQQLRATATDSRQRQAFWRLALRKEILDLVRDGHIDQAEAEIKHAIDCFRAQS